MYIDYVFTDSSERRRIASQAQEVLIDQCQFQGDESITIANNTQKQQNIRIGLNHPVKCIAVVACTQDHGIFTGGPAGTTAEAFAPISTMTLQFNGAQRLSPRVGSYWGQLVAYQTCQSLPMAGIYMWSPAVDPAAHQPSGSANFSRIDSAQYQIRFKQAATNASAVHDILTPETVTTAAATNLTALRVFGFGYNIMRIMGGMAGIASTWEQKSYMLLKIWESFTDKPFAHPGSHQRCMPVASERHNVRNTPCSSGTPLEPTSTKSFWETLRWPGAKPGYGNNEEGLGNPLAYCLSLKLSDMTRRQRLLRCGGALQALLRYSPFPCESTR